MDLDDSTRWLLREQLGLLTRAQLREARVSVETMRWHLGRGWRIVLPGVYALDRGPLTRDRREVAALLLAGPGAALAGLTAARRLGITAADPADTVHVLVPAPRRSRRVAWVSIQRTRVPDPRMSVIGAVAQSNPARAVLDAATQCRARGTAEAIAIEAVQRRLVTVDDLVHEFGMRNRRNSSLARIAMEAAGSGAWSRPEALLLARLERSSILPPVWSNPQLHSGGVRLTTPDLWIDDVALAVMVHSRQYHSSGGQWDRTVEADAQLTEAGVIVVGVTPHLIHRDIDAVASRVERTYVAARRRPRPPVRATRRSVLTDAQAGASRG